jgi:GTP cyclohydrolase I
MPDFMDEVAKGTYRMLAVTDPNPRRDGLIDTPQRVARAWAEKMQGYAYDDTQIEALLKTFDAENDDVRGMCVVRDIEVESTCEHHLERIWGHAHIGYLPQGRVLGLSKLQRLVTALSRRLQVQERLTAMIANTMQKHVTHHVGVVLECRHACMEVRGVRVRGQVTCTSELRGVFYSDPIVRNEFLALTRESRKPF